MKFERGRELPIVGPVVHFTVGRFMLNNNYKCPGRTRFARHNVDSVDHNINVADPARARAKNILDVNDEQGGWHELAA